MMKRPDMSAPVVILAGSNMGDRLQYLKDARDRMNKMTGKILKSSAVYETAAWGKEDQPAFLNQAHLLSTALLPGHLLEMLLEIEKEMGRIRTKKWDCRTIDLDILFFGDQVINENGLQVPHPQIAFRRFALVPLAELLPDFIHPVSGLRLTQLITNCQDTLQVKVYDALKSDNPA